MSVDGGKGNGKGGDQRRILRVEKEMREIIGAYLIHGFRGKLHGLVSVPRVSVSRDLKYAKVYVSIMGTEDEQQLSLESLEAAAHDVQAEVNRQMRVRFVPRVSFHLDSSLEKTLKVERILHDLAVERARREKQEE